VVVDSKLLVFLGLSGTYRIVKLARPEKAPLSIVVISLLPRFLERGRHG
jgi:hypothetical protein